MGPAQGTRRAMVAPHDIHNAFFAFPLVQESNKIAIRGCALAT
jgi:hypothetical protein